MNHIPEPISANQRNPEHCKKFLAGNRSSFYQGFWNNAPYKESEATKELSEQEKAKPGKN